jgi:hypothetical protein
VIRVEAFRRGSGEVSMTRLLCSLPGVDTPAGFQQAQLSTLFAGLRQYKDQLLHFSQESKLDADLATH